MELLADLSQELKQKLTIAELETLSTLFKSNAKGAVVEASQFEAVREGLVQKFGAPEVFAKAFSAHKKPSLSFADFVSVSIP